MLCILAIYYTNKIKFKQRLNQRKIKLSKQLIFSTLIFQHGEEYCHVRCNTHGLRYRKHKNRFNHKCFRYLVILSIELCNGVHYTVARSAQWFSGTCRVLDSRSKGCGFEPHRMQCVVPLSKTRCYLLSIGSTQKDRPDMTQKLLTRTYETNITLPYVLIKHPKYDCHNNK